MVFILANFIFCVYRCHAVLFAYSKCTTHLEWQLFLLLLTKTVNSTNFLFPIITVIEMHYPAFFL